jgi:uroporphyrinogen-III decarboxylase
MLDIVYRRDLVKAAVDRLTPLSIDKAVRAVDTFGIPIILVPLHWGSDGFMSDADYRELYWPPLEALIRGCVDEGVVPLLWTEADYSSRLPVIAEAQLPPGRTLWGFEDTPMKLARDMIGDRCAITGNFPVSLLEVGDEAGVRATVLRLFDDAAGDGNFIFNLGASADEGRPENVHAMFDEAKRLSGRDDAG